MSLISWDDTLSVGFDEIDAQHKDWIRIVNDLHDVLDSGDAQQLSGITEKSLAAMVDYAHYHFEFEEQFMEKIGTPGWEKHKQMHARFTEYLLKIQDDTRKGFQPLNTQLMSILRNWLIEHILTEDKKIGSGETGNLAREIP